MTTQLHTISPEDVMALLDGELSPNEAQAVQTHLAECPEYAALAAGLQQTSESLALWTVPPSPNPIEAAVLGAAAQIAPASKPTGLWHWKPWIIGAGACASLLFLIVLTSTRQPHSMARLSKYAEPPAANSAPMTPEALQKQETIAALQEDKTPALADSVALPSESRSRKAEPLKTVGRFTPVQSPLIARTVSLTLQVQEIATARTALDQILTLHHAYTAQLTVSSPESSRHTLQASLRIPAPELPAALTELKALGRVENESQSGEEVTQQHVDLAARLENSRETETRLQAILRERTGKVSDVLEVEEEIARVRGEIESMQSQQDALEHRVDFATVDLQLSEPYKASLTPPADSASTRLHNAFLAGYQNATETLLGFVLFAGEYGPAILIWLAVLAVPAFFLHRRYRRLNP